MGLYVQIIFLVMLGATVFTLLKYTQEGDILTLSGSCPKVLEMKKKYTTRQQVVERLRDLISYSGGYVRWNRLIVLSLISAIIILYFCKEDVKLPEILILTAFIFCIIDIPNRWGHAHVQTGVNQEANQLITHFSSLLS
jgi:hypothetical protein